MMSSAKARSALCARPTACLSNMTSCMSVLRLSVATVAGLQRVRGGRSHGVAVALTRRRLLSSSNRTAPSAESASDASVSAALPVPDPRDQKVLHVAVAGLPNAGKSTLLNYMVGDKVSAVSTKRHTTRENTLGVMTVGKAQIFFHDTPGFVSHKERHDYKPALSAASREAIETVNLTLLLVDASKDVAKRGLRSLTGLLEEALMSPCELFLVLNKADLVNPRHRLLETTDEIMDRAQEIMDRMDKKNSASITAAAAAAETGAQERTMGVGSAVASGEEDGDCSSNNSSSSSSRAGQRRLFRDGGKTVDDHITVFMVSAKTGDGVKDIVDFLEHRARPGAWLFGRDETTNKDKRTRIQEIVREGLFKHLYKELPYQIQTHTSALSRKPDNSISVLQELRVERKSQKRIVLGKLRYLQKDVEWDLRKLFGTRVNVEFSIIGGNK